MKKKSFKFTINFEFVKIAIVHKKIWIWAYLFADIPCSNNDDKCAMIWLIQMWECQTIVMDIVNIIW